MIKKQFPALQPDKQQILVFTDLDGTLLDHDTYSADAAVTTLERLKSKNIPVIANSSKTLSEIAELTQQIPLADLYIFENGSGIAVGQSWQKQLGPVCEQWQEGFIYPLGESVDNIESALKPLAARFTFKTLSSMSVSEFSELTGLNLKQAELARQRRYSMPLLWLDEEAQLKAFTQELAALGLLVTRGGRFVHVQGPTTKAAAMQTVCRWFSGSGSSKPVISIALGDAPNDKEMLFAADIAVVVPNDHGQPLDITDHPNYMIATRPGPAGWAEAINQLLSGNL